MLYSEKRHFGSHIGVFHYSLVSPLLVLAQGLGLQKSEGTPFQQSCHPPVAIVPRNTAQQSTKESDGTVSHALGTTKAIDGRFDSVVAQCSWKNGKDSKTIALLGPPDDPKLELDVGQSLKNHRSSPRVGATPPLLRQTPLGIMG